MNGLNCSASTLINGNRGDATKLFAFDTQGWHDGGAAPNAHLARLNGAAGPLLKVHLIEQWLLKKALRCWAAGTFVALKCPHAWPPPDAERDAERLRMRLSAGVRRAQACPP